MIYDMHGTYIDEEGQPIMSESLEQQLKRMKQTQARVKYQASNKSKPTTNPSHKEKGRKWKHEDYFTRNYRICHTITDGGNNELTTATRKSERKDPRRTNSHATGIQAQLNIGSMPTPAPWNLIMKTNNQAKPEDSSNREDIEVKLGIEKPEAEGSHTSRPAGERNRSHGSIWIEPLKKCYNTEEMEWLFWTPD